ncbi:uncharacterized protein LOC143185383 [Calliopsis andreniformis]|uniref:uncharacterized protein LOC143185383 n=1 Tax=Calliopsis andreniformis TaxID=337506 RepID=UPI003FCD94F3
MYEPKVLRIQKPNSLAGTPGGKVKVIINLLLTVIPVMGLVSFSQFLIRKRQVIDELEGNYLNASEIDEDFDFSKAKYQWKNNIFINVFHEVRRREISRHERLVEEAVKLDSESN